MPRIVLPGFALAIHVLGIVGLVSGLAGQCSYPRMPRGGFAITEHFDVPITFADGAKTRIDVYHPTTRVACRWPLIFYVHGMAQNRTKNRSYGRRMARRGYSVAIWDVRGQGDAKTLNGGKFGFKYVGDTERLDVVELVQFLGQRYPADLDISRLGMIGFSQGAMYCWAAAAWSGRALPTNARNLTRFPDFKAVCPMWWAPLSGRVLVPQGKGISGKLFDVLYAFTRDMTIEKAWHNQIDALVRNEDFAGLAGLFDADPFRQELTLLKSSQVPVLVQVSWNDDWVPLAETLAVFDSMPKTTPKRALLSFPGHDGPRNTKPMQFEILKELCDRWTDRFMKDDHNGVEHEAPIIAGAVHQTAAEFRGWEPVWNRYHFQWPPAGRQHRTWYLRAGKSLAEQPPAGVEPTELVRHVVPANYDMAALIAQEGHVFNVLRSIPTVTVPFETPPLTSDFEIVGAPSMVIEVDPTGKNYQLQGALYRVEPSGAELFLAAGAALMRESSVHPVRLQIEMNHVDAIVRRGQRLRLRLTNLTYRPAEEAPSLLAAPYFESVDLRIHHSGGASQPRISSLTIPYLPFVAPALLASHITLDVSRQPVADVLFRIRAPTYPASTPYVIVFGGAGMSPGYTWAGRHVHMNWDPLISSPFLQLLNTPILPFTLGTLGNQIQSSPRLVLSKIGAIPPGAAGFRLIAVGSLADGNVTNPVDLFLR